MSGITYQVAYYDKRSGTRLYTVYRSETPNLATAKWHRGACEQAQGSEDCKHYAYIVEVV